MATHNPLEVQDPTEIKQLVKASIMATQNPLEVQDPTEIKQLVKALSGGTTAPGKHSFKCKQSTFQIRSLDMQRDYTFNSWKFSEWAYKRTDLPTYARGLFTTKVGPNNRIAVRGYDKFFNVNEVKETQWENIESETVGPYVLSVKENGCIVFISGMEDGTLLVCSKHSMGEHSAVPNQLSHAKTGEKWVERHVMLGRGKSTIDLAEELYRRNLTAVGELCDDSFEEHVLAYDAASSGIYLHGLNYNQPKFATLPCEEVHRFADEWGFKKAKFVTYNNIDAVQQFLEECAKSGTWDGRETEGFVVRCKRRRFSVDSPPVVEDWFFKYKFEEPYLMYRQWRECAKAMANNKYPKFTKHEKITKEYIAFARKEFIANKELQKNYMRNHGIIGQRQRFLQSRGLDASTILATEAQEHLAAVKKASPAQYTHINNPLTLVPIATLGCGKTTVALALVHLFGWGHIQNDNIAKQRNKPEKFVFEVTSAMERSPVVFADRNNHQRRERTQLINGIRNIFPESHLIALHWVHEPKSELLPDIRDVTRRRVLERGDNHQTIRAGSQKQHEITGIMEGFLNRFEGLEEYRDPDDKFDHVINLNVLADSRANLETIVTFFHEKYPLLVPHMPTGSTMDSAINAAMKDYEVKTDLSAGFLRKEKKDSHPPPQKVDFSPAFLVQKIEFFQVGVTVADIRSTLYSIFTHDRCPEFSRFFNQLVQMRRIQSSFHVTLIHRLAKEDRPGIWNHYSNKYLNEMAKNPPYDPIGNPPVLGHARVRLERLVWDDRVMAFVVRLLPAKENTSEDEECQDVFPCANPVPHITVGTASNDIKPKESNDLLRRWLEVGSGEGTGINEVEIAGVKVVEGRLGLIMSRGKYNRPA